MFTKHVTSWALTGQKYWEGLSQSIWDWGSTPHTAKGRVGLGIEGHWIGLQILFIDSLEWDMKKIGYEKAEFSEICKWK